MSICICNELISQYKYNHLCEKCCEKEFLCVTCNRKTVGYNYDAKENKCYDCIYANSDKYCAKCKISHVGTDLSQYCLKCVKIDKHDHYMLKCDRCLKLRIENCNTKLCFECLDVCINAKVVVCGKWEPEKNFFDKNVSKFL